MIYQLLQQCYRICGDEQRRLY